MRVALLGPKMTACGHEVAFDDCTTCHHFFLTDKDKLVLYSFGRCVIDLTCLKLLLVCGLGRQTEEGKVSIVFRIQRTVPPISEDILKEIKFIRHNFPWPVLTNVSGGTFPTQV